MDISNLTIADYLEKLSSDKPVPNAGATLSITGAMGASLLVMAARITLSKKPSYDATLHINDFITNTEKKIPGLVSLGEKDIENFHGFLRKEKELEEMVEAPMEIAETSAEILDAYREIHHDCYYPVKGEALSGMHLLRTAAKGTVRITEINLEFVKEKEKYLQYKDRLSEIVSKYEGR